MSELQSRAAARRRGMAACVLAVASLLTRVSLSAEPATVTESGPVAAPASQQYISREEYDRRIDQLLKEQEQLRAEIDALKKMTTTQPVAPPATAVPGPVPAATAPVTALASEKKANDALRKEVKDLHEQVDQLQLYRPGLDQLVFAGDAAFGFTAARHGNSTFDAGIAPLVLWRPVDRLLIEAAADIGVSTDGEGNSGTSFDLTIANVSYELTDHLLIGGGLFVVPFGVYHNHFDPPWINKFPDDPLPFGDGGIAPGSEVGFFLKGAVPAGSAKITYDAYITNGPSLNRTSADAAGSLNFDDFTDLNGNKAYGGRIGLIPIRNMELGYSLQFSEPNAAGTPRAHATLQAFDFNYRPLVRALGGVIDFRTELIFSDVSKQTYDADGSAGFGPTRFGNYRQGGYVQLCYRPTLAESKFVRDLEFVSRYDWLTTPLNAPGGEHEKRIAFGIDYWLAPNAVLKFAYEIDNKKVGRDENAFMIQFGLGL